MNSAVQPKQKDHISSTVSPSGESITSPADIVNSFNEHFTIAYLQPSTVHLILVLVPIIFILFQFLLKLFYMVSNHLLLLKLPDLMV